MTDKALFPWEQKLKGDIPKAEAKPPEDNPGKSGDNPPNPPDNPSPGPPELTAEAFHKRILALEEWKHGEEEGRSKRKAERDKLRADYDASAKQRADARHERRRGVRIFRD